MPYIIASLMQFGRPVDIFIPVGENSVDCPRSLPMQQRHRAKSIQAHLVALGAPYDEVYVTSNNPKKLFDTMSKAEVIGWAEYLYKKRMMEWHPDKHPGEKERYTRMCQELGEEFQMLIIKLARR